MEPHHTSSLAHGTTSKRASTPKAKQRTPKTRIYPSVETKTWRRFYAATAPGEGVFFPFAKASASSLSSTALIMLPRDLALVSHTPTIPTRMAAKYGVDAARDPSDTMSTYNTAQ